MANQTGSILFICGVCEFEATREAILENHVERKHTRKELQINKILTNVNYVRNILWEEFNLKILES